jgi:hypothetical protein
MQTPIALTDAELDAVFAAAQPIAIERRDAFLRHVAHALQGCSELGPGAVFRAICAAQRAYCDYPILDRGHDRNGHDRVRRV